MLVNGQHYHLTAAISGEKPVLLMLHGFTGTSETFQDSISGLKERFNIIAPDLLGHGNTASPEEISSYTMENICEDLAGILHQLNVSRCFVLGYSMGGRSRLRLQQPFQKGCVDLF